jgi:hypothetical protein
MPGMSVGTSSSAVTGPGTLFSGASFTAVTVPLTTSVSVRFPPDPVFPLSSETIVIVAGPL